jgi:hypothetical protein
MFIKLLFYSLIVLLLRNDFVISSTTTTTTTSSPSVLEVENCHQICSKTYSLHTYPQSEHLNACNRGCRFYILSDLVYGSDKNKSRFSCLNACSLSYNVNTGNESEYYACSIGCNDTLKVQVKTEDIPEDETNNFADNAFLTFKSLLNSMMNRASVIVQRSSMSVYLSRNSDGESRLVVVQSEPEVVVHQYPELIQSNVYDSETVTGSEERTTTDYNKPRVDLSMWTNENPLLVHHPRQHENNSWTNCFGYQSGVPRWILASVLFLAIFVLAWICCATTATAPEQHIRRRVGMGSDLKYLCLYDEPIKMVINDKPPTYQELEAESLPQKTSIDKNESIP